MKRVVMLSCAAALVLGSMLPAQAQDDQEALIEKRDKKLAEDWVKSASWIMDYDKARETAKEKDTLIFGYFTRSYAY